MLILTFGIILFVKSVHGKEYYMKQDSMKDEMIRVQQQYYKSLYENNDNLKRFRHDIKSQLGGLTLLLKQGNSEDAISYLEKITEQYEMIDSNIIHVGNDILDAIINHCSQMAVQKGVSLCVKGKIADIKQMNIYDLCNIFANAINNAVEACERQENIEKIVEINITDNHNTYYLQFINPATSEMYELLQKRVTAKKNVTEHGFGIMNIETAVRRSGGFMEYTYQNNKIILEIFMDI
jgi:sensor histidine kinase regulating citrate/malate metabolism